MSLKYTSLKVFCNEELSELLMAELAESGYDSFIIIDEGFETSIHSGKFNKKELDRILSRFLEMGNIKVNYGEIENKNWNEEWERSYNPVIVKDQCYIRASFHPENKRYHYEIIINPKMSFGTGHHDTTTLMIEHQLETDHTGLNVLDAGCGTGILSIMAEKRNAEKIIGFEIDPLAVENANENIKLNNCKHIEIVNGDISSINHQLRFDLILANINRNTILNSLSDYTILLEGKGLFICSGFFVEDEDLVIAASKDMGLSLLFKRSRNKWSSLVFNKFSG
jgi:ribosomal protein L11 methyltransferase